MVRIIDRLYCMLQGAEHNNKAQCKGVHDCNRHILFLCCFINAVTNRCTSIMFVQHLKYYKAENAGMQHMLGRVSGYSHRVASKTLVSLLVSRLPVVLLDP